MAGFVFVRSADRSTPKRPRRGGAEAAKPLGRFLPGMGGIGVGVPGSEEQSRSAARGEIAVGQSCSGFKGRIGVLASVAGQSQRRL